MKTEGRECNFWKKLLTSIWDFLLLAWIAKRIFIVAHLIRRRRRRRRSDSFESLIHFKLVLCKHVRVMFVSWNSLFGKLFSKLSCVCLPLGKLINGKHFPVKEKFGLVSRKMFSFLAVFVFRKLVSGKSLSKLSCVCLPLEKLVNGKHFPVKEKFGLVFRKVFS